LALLAGNALAFLSGNLPGNCVTLLTWNITTLKHKVCV
jgi:hypothetical protein